MKRTPYAIEPACAADIPRLPAIERAAVSRFDSTQLREAARADTTSLEELAAAQAQGLLWIARASGGKVVGFAIVELLDGAPHLEEVDVHPAHGRRGVDVRSSRPCWAGRATAAIVS